MCDQEMIRFRIPLRRFEASACDDWAPGSGTSLGCPQFLRQILRRRDAGDKAAEPGLALHRAKINCGAVGEVIENLLSPPSPGMMFAHEFAGRVHGALVIRVASILVEALGQIRTVRRHLTERVGRQDGLIFAAPRQDAEQARPCRQPFKITHHQRTIPPRSAGVVQIGRRGEEVLSARGQSSEFLGAESAVVRIDVT